MRTTATGVSRALWRRLALVCCLALPAAGAPLAATEAGKTPDALTVDGGRYFGPLVDGKLHGRGRIEWENGAWYEGEFAKGVYSGKGRMRTPAGDEYEGEFRKGMMAGRGRMKFHDGSSYRGAFRDNEFGGPGHFVSREGNVYDGVFEKGQLNGHGQLRNKELEYRGEFRDWQFAGEGELTYADGRKYRGTFANDRFNGKGRFEAPDEGVFEGRFSDGDLNGPGRLTASDGRVYEGEFKHWRFDGQGVLKLTNGDVYRGHFVDGAYDGQGTLSFAKPQPDGSTSRSGPWHRGRLLEDERQAKLKVESALYAQRRLLDDALRTVAAGDPERINLYLLTVAGDGQQEVFRREVEFVREQFDARFGTAGRSLALINSRAGIDKAPMATLTSLREALRTMAARMDKDKDVLFLFLTSHGSPQHELLLRQPGIDLPSLPAATLGELLRESGIRWKVVVVSACYSGGFIESLRDERTLVITAARHDRTSFGCADENDFTYFGRAFFKEALPGSASFGEAFRKAEALVAEWERQEGPAAGPLPEEYRSHPQIAVGALIEGQLQRWWSQSAKTPPGGASAR